MSQGLSDAISDEAGLSPKSRRRIPGLDGLRAIAILLVMGGHWSRTFPIMHPLALLLVHLVANARLGVIIFFVISGYLITHLLRREWEKSGTLDIRTFYLRRIVRIFPAFYTYLGVMTGLVALGILAIPQANLGYAALFLTNYQDLFGVIKNDQIWFVAHFWTLSSEEQFYLFWPATLLVLGLARSSLVALGIFLLSPLLRVGTYLVAPGLSGTIGMMLHTIADPIMLGCLAALWEHTPKFEQLLSQAFRWAPSILVAGSLLMVSAWLGFQFEGRYLWTVGISLESSLIVFLMLWVIRQGDRSPLRWLNHPIMVQIGYRSYSLYLWQQLILTPLNQTWTQFFPWNFALCFLLAELSYQLIEQPFLKLRRHFGR